MTAKSKIFAKNLVKKLAFMLAPWNRYSKIISYVCIECKYYKINWNVQRHKLVNQQAIINEN